ncbi:MAG: nickel pincer cofactor biosynthesis protein LarB [Planctomycetota bacterium]|jgi:NCAIR mutase (PurE)-related protein
MDAREVRRLLERVRAGELTVEEAEHRLRASPAFTDLAFATVDHHRTLRQGHPEIVFAPGKTPSQAAEIARVIHARAGRVLVTRVEEAHVAALRDALPDAEHHATARAVSVMPAGRKLRPGIAIVTAGTADQPAAEEARVTCCYLGHEPAVVRDVGVAGVHRLLRHADALQRARVVIAVAGMEGALASVVGGLVGVPVIALPTSVGYGTGAGGLAALLSMLNSCASNVSCVNIDNGVGAAVVAGLINTAPPESPR